MWLFFVLFSKIDLIISFTATQNNSNTLYGTYISEIFLSRWKFYWYVIYDFLDSHFLFFGGLRINNKMWISVLNRDTLVMKFEKKIQFIIDNNNNNNKKKNLRCFQHLIIFIFYYKNACTHSSCTENYTC